MKPFQAISRSVPSQFLSLWQTSYPPIFESGSLGFEFGRIVSSKIYLFLVGISTVSKMIVDLLSFIVLLTELVLGMAQWDGTMVSCISCICIVHG